MNDHITDVIEALGEILRAKNDTIFFNDITIKDLRTQLEEAKKEIAELKGENHETV